MIFEMLEFTLKLGEVWYCSGFHGFECALETVLLGKAYLFGFFEFLSFIISYSLLMEILMQRIIMIQLLVPLRLHPLKEVNLHKPGSFFGPEHPWYELMLFL